MILSVRSRAMILFSLITILFTGLLSRFSYVALRRIYIRQTEDFMLFKMKLISEPFDIRYLKYLNPEQPSSAAHQYYQSMMLKQKNIFNPAQIFIFNDQWIILSASDTSETEPYTGQDADPVLLMNSEEILESMTGKPVTTMIFKGKDDQWYLWGFQKLDERHYLGVQENAEQLSDIENLSWMFWGILSLGIIFTFIGSVWIAQTIARPIDSLVGFSRELGRGNLKADIPKRLPAELSSLSFAMDRMRDDLIRQHQDKEQLLAHIAHEIRNPLGGIELITGLIREDMLKEGKSAEYPDTVLNEINRLKSLITAYLSYGRPMPASPQSVPVESLLSDIKTLFKKALEDNNVEFEWSLQKNSIMFDLAHLKQILINLVTNSIHSIDSNGGHIRVTSGHGNHESYIEVSDDGQGIPDDIRDILFEPFISKNSNGFGLGLAVCRKLCQENHADISGKNNPDRGSTFTIRIPDQNNTGVS